MFYFFPLSFFQLKKNNDHKKKPFRLYLLSILLFFFYLFIPIFIYIPFLGKKNSMNSSKQSVYNASAKNTTYFSFSSWSSYWQDSQTSEKNSTTCHNSTSCDKERESNENKLTSNREKKKNK